jgi:hypothetical protein
LTLDHLQQREEHWAIVDLAGKGGHIRTVPVPDLAETRTRRVACCSSNRSRQTVSQSQQSRDGMGRSPDGKSGMAHRKGRGARRRCSQIGASRSSPNLCPALPRLRGRVGTDSFSAGTHFGSDY